MLMLMRVGARGMPRHFYYAIIYATSFRDKLIFAMPLLLRC